MKTLLLCLLAASASVCAAQTPSAAPLAAAPASTTQDSSPTRLHKGAKIFIEPMDGFETYLSAAMLKKNVPVVIVDEKEKADYVVTGTSHLDKAGWAKTIFISPASSAGASITIKDAHNGNLAFAYSVDKYNSARGNQSTAEACAKHLKEAIEKK